VDFRTFGVNRILSRFDALPAVSALYRSSRGTINIKKRDISESVAPRIAFHASRITPPASRIERIAEQQV
jgi:hypothetical protein